MLFKEKLLLSNCDSVRKLSSEEIRKRFLTGLMFADGVVVSPNTLIDNPNIRNLISRKNVLKYLKEEGRGKFVVRGFNLKEGLSLVDYFKDLPEDFIISSLSSSPKKSELTKDQLNSLLKTLELTQESLNEIYPKVEALTVNKNALTNEIIKRISDDDIIGNFFESDGERILFSAQSKQRVSRSQWYKVSDDYFSKFGPIESLRFKAEIIDPAYNSLFAKKGEGFLQDNIKVINNIPEIILDSGVALKSLRNEIQYIEYPIKAFEMISSFGANEIIKFFTDEAISYVEDKLQDKGENYLSRKNWFGMYNIMKNKVGLEVK